MTFSLRPSQYTFIPDPVHLWPLSLSSVPSRYTCDCCWQVPKAAKMDAIQSRQGCTMPGNHLRSIDGRMRKRKGILQRKRDRSHLYVTSTRLANVSFWHAVSGFLSGVIQPRQATKLRFSGLAPPILGHDRGVKSPSSQRHD